MIFVLLILGLSHLGIQRVNYIQPKIPTPKYSMLQAPSEWTYHTIPIYILPRAISIDEIDTNLQVNQSTLDDYWKSDPVSYNFSINTPWNETIEIDGSMINLNPPMVAGEGEIEIDFNILWRQSIDRYFNETTHESYYIYDEFYINGSSKQDLKWNFSPVNSKPKTIDWTFYDFNYWGPNPAWRVVITENLVWWNSMKNSPNKHNPESKFTMMRYSLTPKEMWDELVELSIKFQSGNWDSLTYKGSEGMCDGPAHVNNVILDFESHKNSIVDFHDFTSCSSDTTWLPEGFIEMQNILKKWIDHLDTRFYFSLLIGGSIVIAIAVIYKLKVKRESSSV